MAVRIEFMCPPFDGISNGQRRDTFEPVDVATWMLAAPRIVTPEPPDAEPAMFALLLALTGLYARQVPEAGKLVLVGYLAAFLHGRDLRSGLGDLRAREVSGGRLSSAHSGPDDSRGCRGRAF
jgi:hypothetical protein